MTLQSEVDEVVLRFRAAGTDLQRAEAKSAAGGFPKSSVDSVSAFANGDGGLLLLGLDERAGFGAVELDVAQIASDLADACAEQLEPPIRPEIEVVSVDGRLIVAAAIDELPQDRKPCFVKSKGMDRGSYILTHDGDRRLTTYEIHVLASSQGQPIDDRAFVDGATLDDLDDELVQRLLLRLRSTRSGVFSRVDDDAVLRLLGVVVDGDHGQRVTLAGLLALGRYPQQFCPQLDATFVVYPTTSGEPLSDGTRFLDNQSIDGPIPVIVDEALVALRRNMKRRSIVVGMGREDRWEYPEEAVREIVANALMHRDYHPMAQGRQVQISLYPDRLEVSSPGGLYGPIAEEDLAAEPVSSSRNAQLAKLLEDVEVPGTGRTVCENRGSGLVAAAAALRTAGIEPPELTDKVREFRVVIRNSGLLDDEALRWLTTLNTDGLVDRQRLGLAYLHRNRQLTNQQYRALTGCDALTATRELTGLASLGLIDKSNDRRWAIWHLGESRVATPRLQLDFAPRGEDRAEKPREAEIKALLIGGPESTRSLAQSLGISQQAVRNWVRAMESRGEVESTESNRLSPKNRWRLVDGATR